ncbi:MAG: hypothetical protein HUU57_15845 [Bdellovibrio sp.]|nr:hypothetical protein [Bdellovibrio sp.]
MELTELKDRIIKSFNGPEEHLHAVLQIVAADRSIYPFNEYEHLISSLINTGGLTYQQYLEIRSEYISENPNLWIFEISAPRGFGEGFAQTYVQGKCSKLKKASKKLDPNFAGEYDLWLDGIKIEVKASRAVDSDIEAPLYVRALSRNTKKNFLMNFQQLKPQCCDVFVWVAVFRDEIVLWVINTNTVKEHGLYTDGQHRHNYGNEGQLHINQSNIDQFNIYQLKDNNIEQAIIDAAKLNA